VVVVVVVVVVVRYANSAKGSYASVDWNNRELPE
jgi:hypothetical protein